MSEIAKCPICGGKPLDKWEVTSARVFQTGQMCCGVDCSTNERWNQYAAAMECQARHNALVETVRLLIITTQPVLGEDGHLWTTEHAVDALAALVGEE